MEKETDLYLITYPRSGKYWLEWYMKQNTDINLKSSHFTKNFIRKDDPVMQILFEAKNNPKKIITIARDPIESLVSINVMEEFMNLEFRYNQYIDHYEYMLNNCDYIFSFEDLEKNTKKIIEYVCGIFNKKISIKDESYENYLKWHKENNKYAIATSKKDNRYEEAKQHISKWNLKKHYELYKECSNKSIKI